jgi:hypothetical protein
MKKSANISVCQTYRWTLTRRWGEGEQVCWVMLNPSTADGRQDDPTIRRIIHFTRSWGFDGLAVVNLYPFRSPKPEECRQWANKEKNDPDRRVRDVLQRNAALVAEEAKRAEKVVAAWGAAAWDPDWIESVVERITRSEAPWPNIYCLGVTETGAPKHPMARGKHRISDNQQAVLWRAGLT